MSVTVPRAFWRSGSKPGVWARPPADGEVAAAADVEVGCLDDLLAERGADLGLVVAAADVAQRVQARAASDVKARGAAVDEHDEHADTRDPSVAAGRARQRRERGDLRAAGACAWASIIPTFDRPEAARRQRWQGVVVGRHRGQQHADGHGRERREQDPAPHESERP